VVTFEYPKTRLCAEEQREDKAIDDYRIYQDAYAEWREAVQRCPHPLRRPNGTVKKNGAPLFAYAPDGRTRLGYLASRSESYAPTYVMLARRQDAYWKIFDELLRGESVLLIEPDGPRCDEYPQGRPMTSEVLLEARQDTRRPFGHGYVLAWALQKDVVGRLAASGWKQINNKRTNRRNTPSDT
jgi:hypothetical protein